MRSSGWARSTGGVSWKRRFVQQRRAALVGAALTVLTGAALLIFPIGAGLERMSYDLPFALRSLPPPDDVVIVALDELSHQELRQPDREPWDRALYAQVITNLTRWGAKAVVLDVEFDDNRTLTPADRCLAEAIRFHGRVVLGASWGEGHYLKSADTMRLKLPDPDLIGGEANWGSTMVRQDADGAVRRHYHGTEDVPALSWRLARLLDLPATRPVGAQERERWVNYYGTAGALPRLSFARVYRGTDPGLSNVFAGRIVFIGAGIQPGYTGTQKEGFRQPQTWLDGKFSPGVEVHATTFLNLLREDWLRRPPALIELGIVILAGITLGTGLALLRPTGAMGVGLIGVLAVFALACGLMWGGQVWFSWAVICFAQVPVAAMCALVFRARGAAEWERHAETSEFAPAESGHAALRIPDYELTRCIGSGSYGEVWLARNATGQMRAVKVVHRRTFGEDRQFEREFEGLRRFEPVSRRHPGLVQVLHVGRNEAEGFFYYVMELADAEVSESVFSEPVTRDATGARPTGSLNTDYSPRTLRSDLKRRGHLPAGECAAVGGALADALEFLHQQRLVHRDIKPSNIIFVEGRPKLADIGLVAGMDEARSFVGTEGFIPPEGPGTPQADVFSLGRVLYEMWTGLDAAKFPLFPGVATDSDRKCGLEFEAIIRRACHVELCQRHPSAAALCADLERLAKFTGK